MYIGNLNLHYFRFEKHKFQSIVLDAITSQEITLQNIVAEHSLETGEALADAIINKPEVIRFSAVISDMPQDYKEEFSMAANLVQSVFGSKKLRSSKSVRAWYDLYKLWKEKVLVTVTSPIQIEPFNSMSIEDIVVTLDNDEALKFTCTLRHIDINEHLQNFNLAPEIGKQSSRK